MVQSPYARGNTGEEDSFLDDFEAHWQQLWDEGGSVNY